MADDIEVVRRSGTAALNNYQDSIDEADALVRGAIESLKKPIEAPVFNRVDTTQFKEEIGRVNTSREVANMTVGAEQMRFNDASIEEKQAIMDRGAAEADQARADQARAQQESDLYKSIIDSLGVNPTDLASVASRLAVERPIAEAKLRALQESQSVGLLDNPLEWLVNTIQQPALANDYNRSADIVDALQGTLDASIMTANNAALLNSKSIPQITAAQGAAKARVFESEAKRQAALADEKLAAQNISYAQQKLANDLSVAQATQQSTQMDIEQSKVDFQVMIQKIAAADSHANRQIQAAKLLEVLEKNKGLDPLLASYDRVMGNPAGTTTRYTFEKFSEAQRTNIVAIGAGSGGTDPFQSIINITGSGLRPGPLFTSGRLLSWVQDKAATIQRTPQIQQLDKANQGAAISAELKKAIEMEKADAHKIGSVFYEASPKEMILSGAISKESTVAKMLAPFAEQEMPVQTGAIVAMFDTNFPNPTEAGAALSDYYRKNIALRNSTQNYRLFGITPDKSYKLPVRGTMFGAGLVVDLTRPEDATKLILYNRMVNNRAQAMQRLSRETYGRMN